jgi:hypothetical protein
MKQKNKIKRSKNKVGREVTNFRQVGQEKKVIFKLIFLFVFGF